MKKFRKLSIILAVAIAVSSVPASVWATEDVTAVLPPETEQAADAAETIGDIPVSGDQDSAEDVSDSAASDGGASDETSAENAGEDQNAETDSSTAEEEAGEDGQSGEISEEKDEILEPVTVTVKLNSTEHIKYMNGSSDGKFHPGSALTRAEAAQMIFSLLDEPSEADIVRDITFRDVSSGKWYEPAISALAKYGVMNGSNGQFRPEAKITRAEFVKVLSSFYMTAEDTASGLSENTGTVTGDSAGQGADLAENEGEAAAFRSFADVSTDFWGHDVILFAAQRGWINGYADGTFRPENTLTRAEAAVILNRVLGRTGDSEEILTAEGIRMFPDVDESHWAYIHIMEASIGHEYTQEEGAEKWTSFTEEKTVLRPGTHVIDGVLYYVDAAAGDFVRNQYVDGHWYDENGKFTTGNAELDSYMRAATAACVNQQTTQHQMLRDTFDYVVNNFTYRAKEKLETGATGWTEAYAVPMFQTHKGNCYSFTAVHYYLIKNIGYNPREIAGLVGNNRRPHGWIELDIDGVTYIYDAELTMAKRAAGQKYDLFEMTYENAPFLYAKE